MILAGDLGCLLHLAGRASRKGESLRIRHTAEVLANMADGPAIGEGSE
jgi:L-lactate dehydrogenase complex protein LldE